MMNQEHLHVAELASRLKFVTISAPRRIDLSRFPDFLIIGPQHTGTTWLAANLRAHPQVFVSNPKEIYFFSSIHSKEHRRYRTSELSSYLKYFRDSPLSYTAKMIASARTYGERYRPITRGEATATYAAMRPELIQDIVSINPDIKAILMIRHPVDRAWSHAKKDLARRQKRKVSEVPDEDFVSFFSRPYQLRCGQYTKLIETWTALLKEGNLFVGRFDEIHAEPAAFLSNAYQFLGVRYGPKYVTRTAFERINTTSDSQVPARFRTHLRALFAEELTRMRESHDVSWD